MCEFIDKNTNPDGGFEASEDIVCYKVLRTIEDLKNSYRSTVYEHVWEVGQTYNTALTVIEEFSIYERIHYWDVFKHWKKDYVRRFQNTPNYLLEEYVRQIRDSGITYRLTDLLETKCGFYSYARYMNERMTDDIKGHERFDNIKIVVGRFAIPKGSRYYVNDDASVYISDALRFDGVVGEYINCAS